MVLVCSDPASNTRTFNGTLRNCVATLFPDGRVPRCRTPRAGRKPCRRQLLPGAPLNAPPRRPLACCRLTPPHPTPEQRYATGAPVLRQYPVLRPIYLQVRFYICGVSGTDRFWLDWVAPLLAHAVSTAACPDARTRHRGTALVTDAYRIPACAVSHTRANTAFFRKRLPP